MALDTLTGLFPEDRGNRKSAISKLDAFHEDVECVKADLAAAEQDLKTKVEAGYVQQEEAHAIHNEAKLSEKQNAQCTSARCADPSLSFAPDHAEMPVPGNDFWEQLVLPLNFRFSNERNCYTAAVSSQRLDAQEVHLELSPDASVLTISGTHLPSAIEFQEMKGTIEQHLATLGRAACDLYTAKHLYAKLGRGSFGHFLKSLQVPRDVDVKRIEASCKDGVLRVKFPKQVRPYMRHPLFSHSPFLG